MARDQEVDDAPMGRTPEQNAELRRRGQDINGNWTAVGVDGGAVVSDQFMHDANRYRRIGQEAGDRYSNPVQLDQGAANQSRGVQMGALGLLRAQASGQAPSSAAILSQRANQNAGRMAAGQVAGARGPGAAIAAFGGANAAASGQAMAQNAQNAQLRAGEISRGQGAYTTGAGAMRGQDINAATANAQLDAEGRRLAEQQQQYYERMAHDVRGAEMGAMDEAQRQNTLANQQDRQSVAAERAADYDKAKTVASLGIGAFTSDPRAKTHIGSLGHLMRGR